ncbi:MULTISPECIES: ankyrin repeat domain-containing protein [Chryseobacterium]|uniref:Uncharacterized protein n=1 Tax=Chryseobacterium piscium TaxID=333702 RepID=A0A3D9BD89_9FLAO|nr:MULTISPECIES: ankyrin repeat domain-containing protein [Chryseobacterium]MBW3521183.1 ankyrin repeat domain-containing protein [Chryseobacterium sp. NKUCC03_KSP]REC51312.1 hypothetical protein DRF62_17495 [Chryseobacterium piscium]
MEIELQRKLAAMIQADKDMDNVIKTLDKYQTEIDLIGGTPLNHAVNYNRNEIIKYLIYRDANVNALFEKNYSPLMSAVDGKNIEIVKLLLEKGANVNLKDKYGNDALFKAVDTLNLDLIKLLIEAGSNPFIGNNPENYSAYDSAKDIVADEVVRYFDSLK